MRLNKQLFVQDNIVAAQKVRDEASEHSGKGASVKSGGSKRNLNSIYSEIQSEAPPLKINMGPFDIYAIIDGHRGEVVAEFIRDHLMDVILRNENIMIYRYFSIGLK